ncbi:hypothetical protein D3C80_1509750 [compost metagenome]
MTVAGHALHQGFHSLWALADHGPVIGRHVDVPATRHDAPDRRLPVVSDPVVPQLLLVGREYAEHGRSRSVDQFPPAAVYRVLPAPDPPLGLQRIDEGRHGAGLGQPLIDGALLQTAVIGVHELAVLALALQRCEQLGLQVELGDQGARWGAQVVQPVAAPHPLVEVLCVLCRAQLP